MFDLTTEAWREAHRLMSEYGGDAAIEAAMLADAALERGDADQFHAWQRVVRAIDRLKFGAK